MAETEPIYVCELVTLSCVAMERRLRGAGAQ